MQIQFTKTYNGVESPDNEWVGGTTVRAYAYAMRIYANDMQYDML